MEDKSEITTIKTVTFVLKPQLVQEHFDLLPKLLTFFIGKKITPQFVNSDQERLDKILDVHSEKVKTFKKRCQKKIRIIDIEELFPSSGLIITMGGDGTLIGVCRRATEDRTPIFSINMGHLGFITEFTKKNVTKNLRLYLDGKLKTTTVNLYMAEVISKDGNACKEYFVNDAVITKYDISRMFTTAIEVDDEHIYNISGDGVIISSPLGSTAYSLSAGGPITHPEVKAMIITPVCPHALTHRPMVIPDQSDIVIRPQDHSDPITLTLDGQKAITLNAGDIVRITKHNKKLIHLVKNNDRTYFKTLREKFGHGIRS